MPYKSRDFCEAPHFLGKKPSRFAELPRVRVFLRICDALIASFISVGLLNQKLKVLKKIQSKTRLTTKLGGTEVTIVAKQLH